MINVGKIASQLVFLDHQGCSLNYSSLLCNHVKSFPRAKLDDPDWATGPKINIEFPFNVFKHEFGELLPGLPVQDHRLQYCYYYYYYAAQRVTEGFVCPNIIVFCFLHS